MKNAAAFTCALAFLSFAANSAEENPGVARAPRASPTTERMIVKWRNVAQSAQAAAAAGRKSIQSSGLTLRSLRALSTDTEVVNVEATGGESAEAMAAQLQSNPDIEYAVPDRRRYRHATPNDPLYVGQWYLQKAQPAAINATDAWDITTGSSNVVVAILDTGVRFDHPDLLAASAGGRLLPGYDFVGADPKSSSSLPDTFLIANDGDGWDADPSDPGDWVNSTDKQNNVFSNCDADPSSWHGTRVAGIIGAKTNNATGIAGITWSAKLLPVRVLGKCGGFDSDILAAMRWAAGMHVTGVPDNANAAKIINLSLGATGSCSSAYQSLITQLTGMGVTVVVSAGNEDGHAVDEPANCSGVIGVAGIRHVGTKVGYSNIGPQISISAPAGNCVNASGSCLFSIDTTFDTGTTVPVAPGYTDQNNVNLGTSFSAPIVAGVAALMYSVHSKFTPAQLLTRIKQSATAFPSSSSVPNCQIPTASSPDQVECNCTTSTCGAGMLNASQALTISLKPFAVAAAPASVTNGQTVSLDGTGSHAADNRTIVTYAWTATAASGVTAPVITPSSANPANATFVASTLGNLTLRLTVTDDQGSQDFAEVVVATPTPTVTPSSLSGGGNSGGGGTFGIWGLLGLGALIGGRRRNPIR